MRWKRSRRKTRFTKRVCLHRGPRRNVELICLDLTSKQTSIGQSWILKMAFGSSAPAVRVFPRPINACRVDLPSKVCACRRIGSSGRGCDSLGSSRSTLANHQYKVGTTFGLVFICSLLNLLVEPRARLLSASAFLSSICSLGRQRGREGKGEKKSQSSSFPMTRFGLLRKEGTVVTGTVSFHASKEGTSKRRRRVALLTLDPFHSHIFFLSSRRADRGENK